MNAGEKWAWLGRVLESWESALSEGAEREPNEYLARALFARAEVLEQVRRLMQEAEAGEHG